MSSQVSDAEVISITLAEFFKQYLRILRSKIENRTSIPKNSLLCGRYRLNSFLGKIDRVPDSSRWSVLQNSIKSKITGLIAERLLFTLGYMSLNF